MKILIIDDEDSVCESLSKNLNRIGFTVFTENQSERVLKTIDKIQPDIVLLDLVFEAMDGLIILDYIKEKYKKMIVIVITALKEKDVQKRALEKGADDYLTKPFKTEVLRQTIKDKISTILLKHQRMQTPYVLLVDSSEEYRKLLAGIINTNYKTYLTEVGRGQDTFAAIQERVFDLVLLDIRMSDQDGFQVLEKLGSKMSLNNVIVLSGCSEQETIRKVIDMGVFTFISKSDSHVFDELKEKVESILIRDSKLIKLDGS